VKVFSCCTYSTAFRPRSEPEWLALQFVRAIKGKPLKGHVDVRLPGDRLVRLDQASAAMVATWFGELIASGLSWDRFGAVTLVPIPHAACDRHAQLPPKTLPLAQALRDALSPGQAAIMDLLRWDEVIPQAHLAGGTRDPQELYSLLRLTVRRLPQQVRQIVLVDDVLASGGHVRAAGAFLTDCGAQVQMAVVAGRADKSDTQLERPFSIRADVFPDFVADPDWLLPFTSALL
jgi:hypothetical protein